MPLSTSKFSNILMQAPNNVLALFALIDNLDYERNQQTVQEAVIAGDTKTLLEIAKNGISPFEFATVLNTFSDESEKIALLTQELDTENCIFDKLREAQSLVFFKLSQAGQKELLENIKQPLYELDVSLIRPFLSGLSSEQQFDFVTKKTRGGMFFCQLPVELQFSIFSEQPADKQIQLLEALASINAQFYIHHLPPLESIVEYAQANISYKLSAEQSFKFFSTLSHLNEPRFCLLSDTSKMGILEQQPEDKKFFLLTQRNRNNQAVIESMRSYQIGVLNQFKSADKKFELLRRFYILPTLPKEDIILALKGLTPDQQFTLLTHPDNLRVFKSMPQEDKIEALTPLNEEQKLILLKQPDSNGNPVFTAMPPQFQIEALKQFKSVDKKFKLLTFPYGDFTFRHFSQEHFDQVLDLFTPKQQFELWTINQNGPIFPRLRAVNQIKALKSQPLKNRLALLQIQERPGRSVFYNLPDEYKSQALEGLPPKECFALLTGGKMGSNSDFKDIAPEFRAPILAKLPPEYQIYLADATTPKWIGSDPCTSLKAQTLARAIAQKTKG